MGQPEGVSAIEWPLRVGLSHLVVRPGSARSGLRYPVS